MALQRDKIVANAEKLVAKGKIEPAIREYERLLDENPNDVNTLNRIGDLWVRIERNDEAVKVFRRIADHYAKDGFFLKAIAIYKKINKLDPSKLDIYAKLAELYAKQGLAMEAKSQYMVLADYYIKHGDSESALNIYKKIAELDPNSVNVHIKLADLYSLTQNTTEALQEYDRVGRMLLKRGMSVEAVQVFRKALKIDAGNVDLAESLVTALLEEKDHDNAIQILHTALESNRENPRLIVLVGRTHLAKGDLKGAREALEQGLSSNPSDVGVRESLADLYLRQGEADRALELVAPLVTVALNKDDSQTALGFLNKILKTHPDHIGSLERLVAAYTQLKEGSNVTEAMNRLAEAHIAQGNHEQAEPVLLDLIRRDPENLQSREKLTFVQQYTGTSPYTERDLATTAPEIEEFLTSEELLEDETTQEQPLSQGITAPHSLSEPSFSPPGEQPAMEEELEELDAGSLEYEIEVEIEDEPALMTDEQAAAAMASLSDFSPSLLEREHEIAAEDHEFVTEHVAEAEVFAKYGLTEKAVEHLTTVINRVPAYLPAHEKLLAVYMNEGETERVGETATHYISLLRSSGDFEKADLVEQDVWTRGFSLPEVKADKVSESSTQSSPAPASRPSPSPPSATEAPREVASASLELPPDLRFPAEPDMDLDLMPDLLPVELAPESPSTDGEAQLAGETDPDFPAADFAEDLSNVVEATVEPLPEETLLDDAIDQMESKTEVPSEAEAQADADLISPEEWLPGELLDEETPAPETLSAHTLAEEASVPGTLPTVISGEETSGPETLSADMPTEETPAPSATGDDWFEEQTRPLQVSTPENIAEDFLEEEIEKSILDEDSGIDEGIMAEFDREVAVQAGIDTFFAVEEEKNEEDDGRELPSDSPNVEDLGELDFYIDQELHEEARGKFDSLAAQFPNHPEILNRSARLQVAESLAAGPSTAEASPTAKEQPLTDREVISDFLSSADLETDLVFTLPEEEEDLHEKQVHVPVTAASESQAAITSAPVRATAEDDLFAAEDEFFDLAAELEEEFEGDLDDIPSMSEEEQSLEQIFKEFKKGVEQQLDSEDYDTHYNLGIAYKEMGLIDEAIGEFQLASKDPHRAIDGCSMLGLCFLEKGMPQLAIKWYNKGLEVPHISEEEHIGLLYDLGNAYLEIGDMDNAHKALIEVYGVNTKYRDIVGRMKQLEQARKG